MSLDIDAYISEIDTNRFGFKIAKVNDFTGNPEEFLQALRNKNVKLILSKINCDNIDLINRLESLNFRIKDFQGTYKYELKNYKPLNEKATNKFLIREFQHRDTDQLIQIAEEAFVNYGHYSANKRLNPLHCKEIYKDWIKRSCEDNTIADKIFVADFNGEIAGFLSFKLHQGNFFYAAGGIGAVSHRYQKKGVFRLITQKGLKWGNEIGLDWEEHNVLLTNYPTIRSFTNTGFILSRSFTTMHCWID